MSPFFMGFCAEKNVSVSFLTEYGRFLAGIHGKMNGNVLLRREQYRRANDMDFCVGITKNILAGKICNARTVLQRTLRDHEEKISYAEVETTVRRLGVIVEGIRGDHNLDTLRGIEGDAAHLYFSVFDHLIVSQK